jgi:hypothetical protein
MKAYQCEEPVAYLTADQLEAWTEIRPRSKAGVRKLKKLIMAGG